MLKSHRKTILEALGRSPIHPFPARMAPGIALDAIGDDKELRVLDPMAGSGTVLAVARSKGHRAFGFDLDPLAVLLASVWTQSVDADDISTEAEEVLARARRRFHSLTTGSAYPDGSDEETRAFIRYWFDDYARRQLAALAESIRRVEDEPIRNALWVGFSRLIITKSAGASLAMDLSHSRPHRSFARAPVKPFDRFLDAVEVVVSNCPQRGTTAIGPRAVVKHGDARSMALADESIDLVLTSPPYLNAIDYMRCSKFSLVWMGHKTIELRDIRTRSVGTECSTEEAMEAPWVAALIKQLRLRPALSERHQGLLATYAWDMGRALEEVSRVLKKSGRAVYVVGDSTIRGTFIRNSAILSSAARARGFKVVSTHTRGLPSNRRYLPPPSSNPSRETMDARMRREVVVVLQKG